MSSALIALDWGTTHLRAYRVPALTSQQVSDASIECRQGPGVTAVPQGDFGSCLDTIIGDWLSADTTMPILANGMVTSTLGWHEVEYCDCPASIESLVATSVDIPFGATTATLIGGARCTNPFGMPDVLRGEELQALGAISPDEDALVVLPGTHNKWIAVNGGRLVSFVTVLTGELYALLCKNSTLVAVGPDQDDDTDAFDAGLEAIASAGADNALALLFSTRARRLSGALAETSAAAYLSGLLIGADVRLGLQLAERARWSTATLRLVASPALADRYLRAFAHANVKVDQVSDRHASIKGFQRFAAARNKH